MKRGRESDERDEEVTRFSPWFVLARKTWLKDDICPNPGECRQCPRVHHLTEIKLRSCWYGEKCHRIDCPFRHTESRREYLLRLVFGRKLLTPECPHGSDCQAINCTYLHPENRKINERWYSEKIRLQKQLDLPTEEAQKASTTLFIRERALEKDYQRLTTFLESHSTVEAQTLRSQVFLWLAYLPIWQTTDLLNFNRHSMGVVRQIRSTVDTYLQSQPEEFIPLPF